MTLQRIPRTAIYLILLLIFAGLVGWGVFTTLKPQEANLASAAAPAPVRAATPESAPVQGSEIVTSQGVFLAETFTLANGLQIVVLPNHRAPVISHMVWFRVGAADEPRGKSGIAHFLEHLMFKGTETTPPGEYSKRVRALAGQDNAFTSWDYTAYYVSIAKAQLENIMTMEADRMRSLAPPPEHFASEHDVIIEERRQRTDNDPRNKFWDQLRAALFVNHPYGIPILGWAAEMEGLSWEDAKGMYDLWYAPNNAVVVISGDVTAAEVKPLAEKIYGPLKSADTPKRVRTVVPLLPAQSRLTLRDENIREPVWVRAYRVPSLQQNRDMSYALEVLQEALSGGATTRFYKSLVVEKKIATNIDLNYDGGAVDDATLWITATPAPGVLPDTLEKQVDALLDDVVANGVTEDEVKKAAERLQDDAIYARDSVMGPAMVVGRSLVTGSTLEDIQAWPARIQAVTKDDVQKAAATYLNRLKPSPHGLPVTGLLLPKDNAEQAGQE